jgi:hypothetical protein
LTESALETLHFYDPRRMGVSGRVGFESGQKTMVASDFKSRRSSEAAAESI